MAAELDELVRVKGEQDKFEENGPKNKKDRFSTRCVKLSIRISRGRSGL